MFSDGWPESENNLRRKNNVEMSTNPCTYSVPHFNVTDKPKRFRERRRSCPLSLFIRSWQPLQPGLASAPTASPTR